METPNFEFKRRPFLPKDIARDKPTVLPPVQKSCDEYGLLKERMEKVHKRLDEASLAVELANKEKDEAIKELEIIQEELQEWKKKSDVMLHNLELVNQVVEESHNRDLEELQQLNQICASFGSVDSDEKTESLVSQ